MEQLSLAEAKRLSILKWECIIQNNGLQYPIKWPPEIKDLNCKCGFCERWDFPSEDSCTQCELALAMGVDCPDESSPYHIWSEASTKETAQAVLNMIKSI